MPFMISIYLLPDFSSRGSFLLRWGSSPLGFFSAGFFFIWIFSSSDFTDESEGNLAYRITYGFSRIFGRWSMARARNELLLFLSRRFGFPFGRRFPIRRWRRFFLIDYFVPQISRIYTDFLLFPVISSFFCIFFILQILTCRSGISQISDFMNSKRIMQIFLILFSSYFGFIDFYTLSIY